MSHGGDHIIVVVVQCSSRISICYYNSLTQINSRSDLITQIRICLHHFIWNILTSSDLSDNVLTKHLQNGQCVPYF